MTILRPPGLGPLIGHTTPTTCRIWMRADDPSDEKTDLDENRRTVGVIGLLAGDKIGEAHYFRLPREYDRTGVFCLGQDVDLGQHPNDVALLPPDQQTAPATPVPLKPDTGYTVCCGSLTIDDPFPNDLSLSDARLSKYLPPIEQVKNELKALDPAKARATFRTPAKVAGPAPTLAFLLGSCRYPGLLWKIKEADRIFGPMTNHLAGAAANLPRASFTLMVGDQIYGDELNRNIPLLRADTYAEFQKRYVEAFEATNMRRLLSMAPTYMILDDHEIEDNWSQDRVQQSTSSAHLFNVAISAYMNYQWSHSPRNFGRLFYYRFDWSGYPFFVLDTRTQRYKTKARLAENHLLGKPSLDPVHPSQLDQLLTWLTEQQAKGDAPKFIVSSSVFVPNAMDERSAPEVDQNKLLDSDSWPSFPATRKRLLQHIVDNKIQNVVFLSGDIHCSNVAQMSFDGSPDAQKLRAFSITSSAFYWPFPFADGDPNGYVHDSKAAGQLDSFKLDRGTMDYKAWAFTQDDNFCRIDIDQPTATITVRPYDKLGRPLNVGLKAAPVTATELKLAPWK